MNVRFRLLLVAALALTACEAEPETITPQDLAGIFVRRSVCQDQTLNPSLARIAGSSDGSSAAASSELSCGRSAGSCDEFLECAGVDPSSSCDPASFEDRCEGPILVGCTSAGRERRFDCSRDDDGNTTCGVSAAGRVACGTGACTGAEGLRCEDNVLVSCTGGQERHVEDCSLSDRLCVVFDGTVGGCVDELADCTRDECDGSRRRECVASMGFIDTDCAQTLNPASCSVVDGSAECVLAAAECEEGAGECAGAVARFCVGGRWIDLDCALLDATCVDESVDGAARLRCDAG